MINTNSSLIPKVNYARTHPERWAASQHNSLKNLYDGNVLNGFGKKIQTFEGINGLNDMYFKMKDLMPAYELKQSTALTKTARQIAIIKGSKGELTNQTPLNIVQKVSQFGKAQGKVGQLIGFNMTTADEIVSYFMIDDGLASRKRRRMLLDRDYNHIGMAVSPHSQYSNIVVILLAQRVIQ